LITRDVRGRRATLLGAIVVAGLCGAGAALAADEGGASLEARLDSLSAEVRALKAQKPQATRLALTGFVQARWETAENSADTIRVSAGEAATANRNRFSVRRARLKAAYEEAGFGRGVVYLNAGESREVELLEAYVTLLDPWTPDHRHALTIGQQNVPFGFDLEHSASSQELLERSQAERTLFPGERDRGIVLESRWTKRVTTSLGVFNGTTIGEDARFVAADPNGNKAAVGRVRVAAGPWAAAASGYAARAATPLTGPDVITDKTRFGADAQVRFEVAGVGGGEVRGEAFFGRQVNPDSVKALTSSSSGSVLPVVGADLDHFATDVAGGYVTWVQSFGERYAVAARWDTWDPDTGADHDRFSRVTVALHGRYGMHVRATVAYEIPDTERKTSAGTYEDPHDNRWTVQFQHKF
jgi:hypothetical protein